VAGAISTLTWPAYAVVAAAISILLVIGFAGIRRQHDTVDFFLARRSVPAWAACLSFVATEISAVTILSVPATAYSSASATAHNEVSEYALLFIGSSLAKLAVAFLFIPAFYRQQVTTIYDFLGHRLGPRSQLAASIFFLITRLAASAARLTITAVAVGYLTGLSLVRTLVVFSGVSIAYIAAGGVRAVVWTNVFQAFVFLGAGALTLGFVIGQLNGGLLAVISTAGAAARLDMLDWGPSITAPGFWSSVVTNPSIVWVAILNGLVGSMAAFGTDHDFMQRILTVDTQRASQRALILTPLWIFLTLLIYAGVGAALFTYYAQQPAPVPGGADEILPHFVTTAMPELLRGLMLAAIVLSSIDSPLGSLAASFVSDIYRPRLMRARSERHYLWVSRAAVLAFGVVLGVLAWAFAFVSGEMLWMVFKITGVMSGSLLGVFLLGLLTRRPVDDTASLVAVVVMAAVNLLLLVFAETGVFHFAWSWLMIAGTAGTMLLAVLGSQLVSRR